MNKYTPPVNLYNFFERTGNGTSWTFVCVWHPRFWRAKKIKLRRKDGCKLKLPLQFDHAHPQATSRYRANTGESRGQVRSLSEETNWSIANSTSSHFTLTHVCDVIQWSMAQATNQRRNGSRRDMFCSQRWHIFVWCCSRVPARYGNRMVALQRTVINCISGTRGVKWIVCVVNLICASHAIIELLDYA